MGRDNAGHADPRRWQQEAGVNYLELMAECSIAFAGFGAVHAVLRGPPARAARFGRGWW